MQLDQNRRRLVAGRFLSNDDVTILETDVLRPRLLAIVLNRDVGRKL